MNLKSDNVELKNELVAYVCRGVMVFKGRAEYLTPDGWIGIRHDDGSLDEAPATRCVYLQGDK